MKRTIVCLLLAICGDAIGADPDTLYESLDHVTLGRLFLTPDERVRLESRRGSAPVDDSVDSSSVDSLEPTAVKRRPASGIIVARGGEPLVWRNGAFRRSDSASIDTHRFPGTLTIGVHGAKSADTADGSADDKVGNRSVDPDLLSDAASNESGAKQ